MNTKKIWLISMVLGMAVAGFSYLTMFQKGKAVNVAEAKIVQKNIVAQKQTVQAKQQGEIPERKFNNPIVEVEKGKRAISINVAQEQGVSGYIQQNSHVDVIAYETTKDDKTKKEYKSAVLALEDVKVLSSGKASDNKDEALHYQTVTLEVTPEQGVMLSLAAKDKDGFYLMLRNNEDTGTGKAGVKQTREVIKEEDNN